MGGRYRVINQLGVGGFSQTFLAEDLHLPGHPHCVVKQLKPQVSHDTHLQTARRLFDTEARVLYQLGNHDQIPRLLAHFEEQQEFYLVQELVDGKPLTQELMPGLPWSQGRVIRLLRDTLHVLAFVHQQQVIHRDIKPSNLMGRRSDGRVVLIDFGAVKQVSTAFTESNSGQTVTVSIGTQGYMPVEQLSGNPRFSSDIYAVGMVAIQALTGVPPKLLNRDPQTSEILWHDSSLTEKPRLEPIAPEFASILDQMVRYYFKDRYQTVEEPLQALNALLDAHPDLAAEVDSASLLEADPTEKPITNTGAFQPSTAISPQAAGASDESVSAQTEPPPTSMLLESTDLPVAASGQATPDVPMADGASDEADLTEVSNPPDAPSNLLPSNLLAEPPSTGFFPPLVSTSPRSPGAAAGAGKRRSLPWQIWLGLGALAVGAIAIGLIRMTTQPQTVVTTNPAANSTTRSTTKPDLPSLPCREPPPPPLPSRSPDFVYPDGTRFYGPTKAGTPTDGKVVMLFPSGNRYDGEIKDSKRNGCGTLTFANGKRYVGEFKDDQFSGQGIWMLGNGNRYVGAFSHNKCQGKGIYLFADGTSKRGVWNDGRLVNGDLSCDR